MLVETEDIMELQSGVSGSSEGNEPCDSSVKPAEVDIQLCDMEDEEGLIKEDVGQSEGKIVNDETCSIKSAEGDIQLCSTEDEEGLIKEDLGQSEGKVENDERPCAVNPGLDKDLVGETATVQMNVELTGSIEVSESSQVLVQNGFVATAECSRETVHVRDGNSVAGAKRARITYEEEQPSVRVVYNSLTRASKQKLEELLRQWSEWHAQHIPSVHDPAEALQSGEQTVFPALRVGEKKQSAVSFWIDLPPKKMQADEVTTLDGNSVPLYDRGFGFSLTSGDGSSNAEGGVEIIGDAARCFNCGSYSHSLRDCQRPRDSVAVNNARKEHNSKKNQKAAPRGSTRYYEDPPAGKFDGLKPGVLDAETRKLLGLGELDPPPWLNRMRELGYPPGYLDVDDDDEQTGLMIFADGETKPEKQQEDGEISEAPPRKKSVEFPGINAPIPDNADEWLWAARPLRSDYSSRYRPHHRSSNSSEQTSRSYHNSDQNSRRSSHSRDDHSPNYGGGSIFSSRSTRVPSPTYASGGGFRSEYSSGRWSSRDSEDLRTRVPYDSVPNSYPSSRWSERSRFEGPSNNEHRDYHDMDDGFEGRDELRRNYSWR